MNPETERSQMILWLRSQADDLKDASEARRQMGDFGIAESLVKDASKLRLVATVIAEVDARLREPVVRDDDGNAIGFEVEAKPNPGILRMPD